MRRTVFVLMILFFSTLTGVISSNINPIFAEKVINESTSFISNQNNINTFNTSYDSKLVGAQLDLSWDDISLSKSSDVQPTVLDFRQKIDSTYLLLVCPNHAGQLIDNNTYSSDYSILLHLDENNSLLKSFVIDTTRNGCTSSRSQGMTNIILSPNNQHLHLIGNYHSSGPGNNYDIINGDITISGQNGLDNFVAITLDVNNFSVQNTIIIIPSATQNYGCDLSIYFETHVDDNGFAFIAQVYGQQNSNGNWRCLGYTFSNTSITPSNSGNAVQVNDNFIIYSDHSLDFYDSQKISTAITSRTAAEITNKLTMKSNNPPQFLSDGGWVRHSASSIFFQNNDSSLSGTISGCSLSGREVITDNDLGFYYLCDVENQTSGKYDVILRHYDVSLSLHSEINIGSGEVQNNGLIMPVNDRLIISLSSIQTGLMVNNSSMYFGDFSLEVNLTSESIHRADSSFSLTFSGGGSGGLYDDYSTSGGRANYHASGSVMILIFASSNDDKLGDLYIMEYDSDYDGFSDRLDAFPTERTQNSDSDNDGFGDNPLGVNGDDCIYQSGNSTIDLFGCLDTDGDGYSDANDKFINEPSQVFDKDGDGYGDNQSGRFGDACPLEYGESTRDSYGCPDSDFDGWSDNFDLFDNESSQWSDLDGDGYGDELNGFQGDACPKNAGSSMLDRFGCRDTDNDGWSDNGDALPENPTQWLDRDGDGYGDNDTEEATEIDLFPSDGTQWNDTDGDGHGDNPYGTQGDWFPSDPTRWMDSDRDGVADDDDLFDNDATQWDDRDGDGYGDETNGNRPDAFPDDPLEWKDTDDDGIGDNSDDLPFNPSQTNDRDGDGFGDDIRGTGADPFPDDPTQWLDADGDGYGDNLVGNEPDLFPRDITQWFDIDGDGYGDNPNGVNPDAFPDDSTQWVDDDGDGFGDNPNGTNPDPSINDYDNDGYLDNEDPFPQTSSPGDKDNDGVLDEDDAFPSNFREFSDNDADGIGDIEDLDDDNDGYLDEDELRSGSDSLDANSMPVEGFEIIIPGTSISLGAWDLIGIFGGVPLFGWIGFGFVTRNKRCARYEDLLNSANTRDELEKVALRWEYSLMLRMLGPHQGIRLERLRAELDDKFENATYDETEIGYDQTSIVENESKDIPPINDSFAGPTKETTATSTDDSGYEWFKQGEENWYRPVGSDDEWFKLEN